MRRCSASGGTLKLAYTESQGHPLLRAEAARLYESVTPEEMLIAAPEELIFIAMNVLLAPGDHAIVTFPGYQSLYELANALGCDVTKWVLEPDADGWHLDLDALERAITPRTRLLVINFPHNPTGYLPSRSDLERILAIARRHGLYVFSDEMYRLLEYDVAARLPSVADAYERGIALSGLSKTFALPGLRLGWLATHDRGCWPAAWPSTITRRSATARRRRSSASWRCVPARRSSLGTWRSSATTWLSGAVLRPSPRPVRLAAPGRGSVAFPRLRGDRQSGHFCRDVLEQKNVMILPGEVFDYAGNHFRVGLGRTSFREALTQVEAYIA